MARIIPSFNKDYLQPLATHSLDRIFDESRGNTTSLKFWIYRQHVYLAHFDFFMGLHRGPTYNPILSNCHRDAIRLAIEHAFNVTYLTGSPSIGIKGAVSKCRHRKLDAIEYPPPSAERQRKYF